LWPLDTAAPTSQYLRAEASSSLTLTTSAQAIPGTTITFPALGVWWVIGHFDFQINTTGNGILIGVLSSNATFVGGGGQALMQDIAAGQRIVVSQSWFIQVTAVGQTATLFAQKNVAGGASLTNLSHTGIRAILVPQTASAGLGSIAGDILWDAKGDLAVGSGSDIAVRKPVGSDGQMLVADSAQTGGLKWARRVIAGKLDAAGNIVAGSGFNAARTGQGNYSITWTPPMVNAIPIVSAAGQSIVIGGLLGSQSQLLVYVTTPSAWLDAAFYFQIIDMG
jgi:hypothetical protein